MDSESRSIFETTVSQIKEKPLKYHIQNTDFHVVVIYLKDTSLNLNLFIKGDPIFALPDTSKALLRGLARSSSVECELNSE